jgi:hypothetical protein
MAPTGKLIKSDLLTTVLCGLALICKITGGLYDSDIIRDLIIF